MVLDVTTSTMELIVVPDRERGAELVASLIVEVLASTETPRLGLATGGSLEPVYLALEAEVARARPSLSSLRCYMLDEYIGLPLDHPARYRNVIETQVVRPLGLDSSQVRGPDVTSTDLAAACADYEAQLHEGGGIDLQLLGIGANGHIGFNEPGSSRDSRTRVATLTEQTRADNARFFSGLDHGGHDAVAAVPSEVVTEGIATILDARRILLVAWGERKAAAVRACLEGPVTEAVPASLLATHPSVTVVVDRAAASIQATR
jgi:glucosamine-6-phosphate deaminase